MIKLDALEKHFPGGAIIDPAALLKAGLIARIKGRMPAVKILGSPELKKKFVFRNLGLSRAARAKIKEAGGAIG